MPSLCALILLRAGSLNRLTPKRIGSRFAVPTSVDTSSEHIYFFSHSDWIAFTEEHGFEVVNQHIGSTYPETGHDVLIVARMRA